MENYQKLKEVIQAANPEIKRRFMQVDSGGGGEITVRDDNIRLADVLLATDFAGQVWTGLDKQLIVDMSTYVNLPMKYAHFYWNLKDDNLDHQSDETKQFLIYLLVGSQ